MNNLPSEAAAVLANIDPDAYAAGTYTSPYVSMEHWDSVMGIVQTGDFVATGVLNASIKQATDGSGTGSKAITGKSITALTATGTDDNKQALINVNAEELDVDNGFSFVALQIVLTTAGADAGGMLLGFNGRFGPANDNDSATVDEIVT